MQKTKINIYIIIIVVVLSLFFIPNYSVNTDFAQLSADPVSSGMDVAIGHSF